MEYPKRLSEALGRLLQDFTEYKESPDVVEPIRAGLCDIIRTWELIEAVIKDEENEEGEIVDQGSNLRRLRELKDLAYELDGLVDLYDYKLVEIQIKAEEASHPAADESFRREMAEGIRKFNEKFDEVCKRIKMARKFPSLPGKEDHGEDSEQDGHDLAGLQSHRLHGRDKELSQLKERLTSSSASVGVEVTAISGMGGVGKTTLARHAYKAMEEEDYFDIRGWVSTSEYLGFDVWRLTKDAIVAFGGVSTVTEPSVLQSDLIAIIREKKFLLVVDDLWSGQMENWQSFLAAFLFSEAKEGSKILITTRSPEVAAAVLDGPDPVPLGCLSETDGWSFMEEMAFGGSPGDTRLAGELVGIGKKIAAKCRGLPLAIKVIGNLLRRDRNRERWNRILHSHFWGDEDIPDEKRIRASLRLSYAHLPIDLRPWFRSLSFLRKGERISRDRLIRLWMMHGVLDYSKDVSRSMADNKIDDLVSWNLLIRPPAPWFLHREIEHEMHHLMHDLAREVSGLEPQEEAPPSPSPFSSSSIVNLSIQGSIPKASFDPAQLRRQYSHLPAYPREFFGRERELSQLTERLCSDAAQVVAVVGTSGIGKTTLAQHAYRAMEEQKCFDRMGWISASTYRFSTELENVVLSFGSLSESIMRSSLREFLGSGIEGNRCLLVVDDVWDADRSRWEKFIAPFADRCARKENKILITTRFPDVAEAVLGGSAPLRLGSLSEADGWSFLKAIAFRNPEHHPTDLVEIGKEIARKCRGLPLCIRIVGCLLRQIGEDKELWESILRGCGQDWEDRKDWDRTRRILHLALAQLPEYSRGFLNAFHSLPPGEIITRYQLESLLVLHRVDDIIGHLVSHGFLVRRSEYNFEMHDLIHSLARELHPGGWSGPESISICGSIHRCLLQSNARIVTLQLWPFQEASIDATGLRSLAITTLNPLPSNRSVQFHCKTTKFCSAEDLRSLSIRGVEQVNRESLGKMKHLHLLEFESVGSDGNAPYWIFGQYNLHSLYLSRARYLPELVGDLRNLRFLKLETCRMLIIPEAIYTLTNLRVLMLDAVAILSPSVSSLVNLQELHIGDLNFSGKLPSAITKLVKLRSLFLPHDTCLPEGISALTNLRHLRNFRACSRAFLPEYRKPVSLQMFEDGVGLEFNVRGVGVGRHDGHAGLEELKDLDLAGSLGISGLCYVTTREAEVAALSRKRNVRLLELDWRPPAGRSDEETNRDVLEHLKPHERIRALFIRNFPVSILPSWTGDPSFKELLHLRLGRLHNCSSLSPVGHLPSLKSLKLEAMEALTDFGGSGEIQISAEEHGRLFPELEILSIWDCQALEVIPLCKFYSLLCIYVCDCGKLEKIDVEGSSVRKSSVVNLRVARCPELRFREPLPPVLAVRYFVDYSDLSAHERSTAGELYIPGKEF